MTAAQFLEGCHPYTCAASVWYVLGSSGAKRKYLIFICLPMTWNDEEYWSLRKHDCKNGILKWNFSTTPPLKFHFKRVGFFVVYLLLLQVLSLKSRENLLSIQFYNFQHHIHQITQNTLVFSNIIYVVFILTSMFWHSFTQWFNSASNKTCVKSNIYDFIDLSSLVFVVHTSLYITLNHYALKKYWFIWMNFSNLTSTINILFTSLSLSI